MVNNGKIGLSMVNNSSKMVNNANLTELARFAFHNNWNEFLEVFTQYLTKTKHLSDEVVYEYVRIAGKFLEPLKSIDYSHLDDVNARIAEFLESYTNPNSYRNVLASLKNMFELLGSKDILEQYKYKRVMPSFSIRTPSLEDVQKFFRAIRDDRVKLYFHLAIVSSIRPEHILRLYKGLFDTKNNMINTWQKTFSQKNFFFSYYTRELEPILESYLDTLERNDSPLFDVTYRWIQKQFRKASQASGIVLSPKMCRKFSTNWLRRHGMIEEDVNVITGHTPMSIVSRHYLDSSRLKEEYDKATQDLKLLEEPKESEQLKELKEMAKQSLGQEWRDISKPFS
jgi:intergrase/recombinase